jgi:hypothetical protein
MFFFKFKIFWFAISFSYLAFASFDEACLGGNFNSKISHKVAPFSLLQNDLIIKKENCTVNLTFKKWSLFEKKWIVDYCRMPVHIKYGNGSFDVFKRTEDCSKVKDKKERPEFCKKYEELENIVSDEGLIFANGLKEDITSDHGKIYCIYLIFKSYLQDGIVYESGAQRFNGSEAPPKVDPSTTPEGTF